MKPAPLRRRVLVLGDQLDRMSAAFDGLDPAKDEVWMAEVLGESTHVWSSKPRTALFLSAMRHFAAELRDAGLPVRYFSLGDPDPCRDFTEALARAQAEWPATEWCVVEPGDWRVREELGKASASAGVGLEIRVDRHFLCSVEEFARHARGKKQLRMEYFYRDMRRRTGLLMDGGEPVGGAWNFDAENRESFGRNGPGLLPKPVRFDPDAVTREVFADVERHFGGHPGSLEAFDWPVTRADALSALEDFVRNRLPEFGRYQDALWEGEPWLYHSRLSAALNLKLLNPTEVLAAAEAAFRRGQVPLASAEGFIRQILGWREYVRGIYWTRMPGYASANALGAQEPLPSWYWTGDVPMRCLSDALRQTLCHGYAHHIQRLMVTGLFAQLLAVDPSEVHRWYLAVYVDAVEWVELPNTLGMSQHADGGVMASKPYVATGKYLQRMGDQCGRCAFDPSKATGPRACPFTTLYWDFLARHRELLSRNQRMFLQVKNLDRLGADELGLIRAQAAELRRRGGVPG